MRLSNEDEDRVLRLNRNEERNSLSGNWIASAGGDARNKPGYNGEAYVREDRVIPWEVVIDPVSTLVPNSY
jgi:hypothetical protein